MIIVLADDFTGAAEIARIAAQYELVNELQTIARPESGADVLIVDANTRSCSNNEARKK